jgi:hypothetical protein
VPYQVPSDTGAGSRPSKRYQGSARRVKQIRMRGSFTWEMWLLVAWVFFLLLVVLPWMVRHSP